MEARNELVDFVHQIILGSMDLWDGARGVLEHGLKILVDSGESSSSLAKGTTDLWSIQDLRGGFEERSELP
jgi:hypothetical protein